MTVCFLSVLTGCESCLKRKFQGFLDRPEVLGSLSRQVWQVHKWSSDLSVR